MHERFGRRTDLHISEWWIDPPTWDERQEWDRQRQEAHMYGNPEYQSWEDTFYEAAVNDEAQYDFYINSPEACDVEACSQADGDNGDDDGEL